MVWRNSLTQLDYPGATNGTYVYGINDSDIIVGYYYDSTGTAHGYIATPPVSVPASSPFALAALLLVLFAAGAYRLRAQA